MLAVVGVDDPRAVLSSKPLVTRGLVCLTRDGVRAGERLVGVGQVEVGEALARLAPVEAALGMVESAPLRFSTARTRLSPRSKPS